MTGKEIGDMGENAAVQYLIDKGYFIERRNFRYKLGEIDIIAVDRDGCTVFVEVKTRKSFDFGYPSEFVDRRKRHRLHNAALMYCGGEMYMRFDIIEIYYEITDDEIIIKEINHIEDAF